MRIVKMKTRYANGSHPYKHSSIVGKSNSLQIFVTYLARCSSSGGGGGPALLQFLLLPIKVIGKYVDAHSYRGSANLRGGNVGIGPDLVLHLLRHGRFVGGGDASKVIVGLLPLLLRRVRGNDGVGMVLRRALAVGSLDGRGGDVPAGIGIGAGVQSKDGERVGCQGKRRR